jgi:hypothetical protein
VSHLRLVERFAYALEKLVRCERLGEIAGDSRFARAPRVRRAASAHRAALSGGAPGKRDDERLTHHVLAGEELARTLALGAEKSPPPGLQRFAGLVDRPGLRSNLRQLFDEADIAVLRALGRRRGSS